MSVPVMVEHTKATLPGVAGNCASGFSLAVAWITTDAMPVLHALSVLAGIGAALATAVYYIVVLRRMRHKPRRTARKYAGNKK